MEPGAGGRKGSTGVHSRETRIIALPPWPVRYLLRLAVFWLGVLGTRFEARNVHKSGRKYLEDANGCFVKH